MAEDDLSTRKRRDKHTPAELHRQQNERLAIGGGELSTDDAVRRFLGDLDLVAEHFRQHPRWGGMSAMLAVQRLLEALGQSIHPASNVFLEIGSGFDDIEEGRTSKLFEKEQGLGRGNRHKPRSEWNPRLAAAATAQALIDAGMNPLVACRKVAAALRRRRVSFGRPTKGTLETSILDLLGRLKDRSRQLPSDARKVFDGMREAARPAEGEPLGELAQRLVCEFEEYLDSLAQNSPPDLPK